MRMPVEQMLPLDVWADIRKEISAETLDDEGALPLADIEEAHRLHRYYRLAEQVPADSQASGELTLRRQLLADLILSRKNLLLHRVDERFFETLLFHFLLTGWLPS